MSDFFTEGFAIDDNDMHWNLNCPVCCYEMEFKGFFDKDDINICRACGGQFKTKKIYFSNDSYIE